MNGEINYEMQNAEYLRSKYNMPMIFYDELWIQVSSFLEDIQDKYFVSSYGRVYDSERNCIMVPFLQDNRYFALSFNRKKGYYTNHNQHSRIITIHKLTCMAFYGIPESAMQVNHKNSIRTDCYYENLEWATSKENVVHSFSNGNRGIGENSNRNVYSEACVRKICELMQSGIYDYDTITMEVFGHKHTSKEKALIYQIRNRLFWTSVSNDYQFDPSPNRLILTDEQVHSICKIIESDPKKFLDPGSKSSANILALRALGIDLHSINESESKRIRTCISNIKRKCSYKDIVSQYNF